MKMPPASAFIRIPPELKSGIFLHCLPSHEDVRPFNDAAPLLLSHICREWRELAHSTPELRTSLKISSVKYSGIHRSDTEDPYIDRFSVRARSPPDAAAEEEAMELISMWFRLAKSRPLSLTLPADSTLLPLRIQSFVCDFAHQLRHLELYANALEQLQLKQPAFNVLESIAVHVESDEPRHIPPIFAPSLREIHFRGNLALPDGGNYPLLTEIHWSETWPEVLISTLRRLPQLLYVTAKYRKGGDLPQFPDPATPSLLESLSIEERDDDYYVWPEALSALTLPNLRHLCLTEYSSPSILHEFVERSGCTLCTLTLVPDPSDEPSISLPQCLRAIPSLTGLHIAPGSVLGRLLDLLTADASVLPSLITLKISRVAPQWVAFSQLLALLESRAPVLSSFHLVLRKGCEPGLLSKSQIHQLKATGVAFKITLHKQHGARSQSLIQMCDL